jgi:hypothetical protein
MMYWVRRITLYTILLPFLFAMKETVVSACQLMINFLGACEKNVTHIFISMGADFHEIL